MPATPVKLTDPLYNFRFAYVSPFTNDEPIYISRYWNSDAGDIAECDDPNYDPFDGDCPQAKKRIHPKIPPIPEVRKVYLSGRKETDLLWTLNICLVKEEHASAIAAEGFSGLEIHPVDLYRDARCRKPMGGYVELRAVGRVPIDIEGSGVKIQYACPHCGFTRYSHWNKEKGLRFVGEYDEWPDVFAPEQPVIIAKMVKTRFAQFLVDRKLSPFMLVRLEDMKPHIDIFSRAPNLPN